jgi:hypothetical protein
MFLLMDAVLVTCCRGERAFGRRVKVIILGLGEIRKCDVIRGENLEDIRRKTEWSNTYHVEDKVADPSLDKSRLEI